MIPVVQTIVGDGKDGRPMGDCFRACVASIFELAIDEVPHFTESPSWYRDLGRWVAARGPIHVDNETNREIVEIDGKRVAQNKRTEHPHRWHRGYWIGCVNSENFGDGATHAVVMLDGGVAHDPSPHPRRTPYEFIGGTWFVCTNPAAIGRGTVPMP